MLEPAPTRPHAPRAHPTRVWKPTANLFDSAVAIGIILIVMPWAIRSFSEQTGLLMQVRITPVYFAGALVLLTCALLSVLFARTPLHLLKPAYQMWLAFLAVSFTSMVFVGLMRSNPLLLLVQETIVILLFLSGVILGASFQNWFQIDRVTLTALAFLGIPTVIMGYLTVGALDVSLLRRGTIYSASVILLPGTFYMLSLPRLRSKRLVFMAVLGFLVWTVLQLLFLKRAPLLRAGATVALALIFLPKSWRSQRFIFGLATSLALVCAAILLFATEPGRDIRRSIVKRFQVFDVIETYISGVRILEDSKRYDLETFRFRESGIMIENMTWPQRIYGIGAGGYISDPRLAHWDLAVGDRIIPSAKNALHIGALWSFVKGGLLLFLAFQIGLVALLLNWPRMRGDPLAVCCWLFVAINFAFSFVEGFWMQPGAEGLTFMMGAAVGYCILRVSHPHALTKA